MAGAQLNKSQLLSNAAWCWVVPWGTYGSCRSNSAPVGNARMSFRASSQIIQAAAAREGAGLAFLPYFIGKSDPALTLCILEHNPPARGIWMVTRRQDRKSFPIRVAIEHLQRILDRERHLFNQPD